MRVIFYKNLSEPNRVDKTEYLSNAIERSGRVREEASVYNPVIQVEGSITDFAGVNYLYVPDFSRYYFLSTPTIPVNGIVQFEGRCDVLMSFKTSILNLACVVKRQQYLFNTSIVDPLDCDSSSTTVDIIQATTTPFNVTRAGTSNNEDRYVLSVVRG